MTFINSFPHLTHRKCITSPTLNTKWYMLRTPLQTMIALMSLDLQWTRQKPPLLQCMFTTRKRHTKWQNLFHSSHVSPNLDEKWYTLRTPLLMMKWPMTLTLPWTPQQPPLLLSEFTMRKHHIMQQVLFNSKHAITMVHTTLLPHMMKVTQRFHRQHKIPMSHTRVQSVHLRRVA